MNLSKRWTPLKFHPLQQQYMYAKERFCVLPCGRRSGKSERAKRKLVIRALTAMEELKRGTWKFHNANFFAAAPTYAQAKRIYWQDLKDLIPKNLYARKPKESELILTLKHNVEIHVIGMDKPERIEGSPWDGGILDEYANMKKEAWTDNTRPALSDRKGWCDLIGVPEGRNHYWDLWKFALSDTTGEWLGLTWPSSDILDPAEVESAKRTLDPLTFQQEYEASFVSFAGRAYYNFDELTHCSKALAYNQYAPLVFCFDFNVSPGVCSIAQEQILPGCFEYVANPRKWGHGHSALIEAIKSGKPDDLVRKPVTGTGVIGEVYIPQNSNTPAVCRKLIEDWGDHQGDILCYGDATGGARGTAKVAGTDWELIEQMLMNHFGDRVYMNIPKANPAERKRLNAVNSRMKTVDGTVRMLIDGETCPNLVRDFEGVRTLEGGSGEIDKKADAKLSHISDALGYYLAYEFPIYAEQEIVTENISGRF